MIVIGLDTLLPFSEATYHIVKNLSVMSPYLTRFEYHSIVTVIYWPQRNAVKSENNVSCCKQPERNDSIFEKRQAYCYNNLFVVSITSIIL